MRHDGKFMVGNEIPEGQGSVTALLSECFDLAYELRTDADAREESESDDDDQGPDGGRGGDDDSSRRHRDLDGDMDEDESDSNDLTKVQSAIRSRSLVSDSTQGVQGLSLKAS